MIGRTVIQVAVGFSGSRLSGVSDYQPKWVAQLTVSDHGDFRLNLGNNRKREKTKRDALEQREELHTDHRIILHAPHEDQHVSNAPRRALAAFLALLLASTAVGQVTVFPGKVVGVTDGDTVKVLIEGNQLLQVRLSWIDAPEKSQAF
jgi:hypothetical protein